MISRTLRHALIALTLTLAPAVGHAAAWDIDQLMRGLAQTRSERANFVEKKFIAILDKPVESSGELFYTAPDRLEKRTLKPRPESMIVMGDALLIERGRQKFRVRLQATPELAAFIDSIRGTLAGDRKALERHFRLGLEGTAERWTLQLQPIDASMLAVIRQIRISGAGDQLDGIEITQSDGDRSLMRMEKSAAPR